MRAFRRFGLVVAGGVVVLALAAVASASGLNAITNGDFQTGSLAPWTTFTTANGTINGGDVQAFDTTGGGASLAAHFNVGQVVFNPGVYEGGGIRQNFIGSGSYTLSADIAAFEPLGEGNDSCGKFDLLLDGTVVASHDFGGVDSTGLCNSGETDRFHLSAAVNTSFAIQTHQVQVRITRPFIAFIGGTPEQYVDDILVVRKLTKVT
jgi:hypothetical protein